MSLPEPNPPNPASAVHALAEACQQLARQARFLVLGGVAYDAATLEPLETLVKRASAECQHLAQNGRASTFAHAAPGKVLALRMLQSGAAEPDPAISQRDANRAPSPRHKLNLRGAEGIFSAADLISFLSVQQKTGMLEIKTKNELFLLEFDLGQIAHVQGDNAPEGGRLGDILVDLHSISRADLESARKRNARGRLGEVLVKSGLVREEQLFVALQRQIHELFQRLFNTQLVNFTFWAGPLIHAQERMRLNPTTLLLDCARLKDEQTWLWSDAK